MGNLATLTRARVRASRNSLVQLREHSLFKIVVITIFAVCFWIGLLLFFYRGFEFLFQNARDLRPIVIDVFFGIFFFSLALMLTFSNGIIAFTSLFRSEETQFLFSNPVRPKDVFTFRLFDGLMFSSWAFMFLGLPLIIAHGLSAGMRWYFYPISLAFMAVFILIPAAVGSLAALLIGRYFAHHPRRVVFFLFGLGVVAVGGWAVGSYLSIGPKVLLTQRWVLNVIGRFSWANTPLLPSFWISRGIQAAGDGGRGLVDAGFYLLVTLANAVFLTMIAREVAGRIYEPAYHVYHGLTGRRRPRRRAGRIILALLFPFDERMRHLILKDILSFRRDPVQWSQALIFFGLLGVYLLNMRSRFLNYQTLEPYWKNLISLLNLTATSLTLSTFTSRFVYPLLSLEGRRFWVLGLAPIERRAILRGKFYFAFMGSGLIAAVLMLTSDLMLGAPFDMILLHLLAVIIICGGLSGLAVGLGAIYPNLREDNPSKIVSGFGGTLNLVLSMVFVGAVVGLLAVPTHLFQVTEALNLQGFRLWLGLAMAIALGLGALTTFVPLSLGEKAFEKMEV